MQVVEYFAPQKKTNVTRWDGAKGMCTFDLYPKAEVAKKASSSYHWAQRVGPGNPGL